MLALCQHHCLHYNSSTHLTAVKDAHFIPSEIVMHVVAQDLVLAVGRKLEYCDADKPPSLPVSKYSRFGSSTHKHVDYCLIAAIDPTHVVAEPSPL
jgi:hypothetical protein